MSYPDVPESSPTRDVATGAGLGLLSSIPVVGGVLSGGIQAALQAQQRQLDEEFFAFLAARVARIEASTQQSFDPLDPEFIASVNKVRRAAHETSDSEKQRLLAEAAAECGTWSRIPVSRRERYIDYVIRLTPWHIRVLVFFRDPARWFAARDINVAQIKSHILMGSIQQLLSDHVARGDTTLLGHILSVIGDLNRDGLTDVPLRSGMSAEGVFAPRITPEGSGLLDFLGDAYDFLAAW